MTVKILKTSSVPDQTGCIFTRPDFKDWPVLLRKNRDSLSAVNNRNISRSELINIAVEYTRRMGLPVSHLKSDADIIVTGHQPNWHHCGIFAKNIITDRFAKQANAAAVQLVLDHDICDTSISLPQCNHDDFPRLKTVPLEQKQQNIPLELRPAPSREQLRRFIDSVSKISKDSFCSEIWYRNPYCIIEDSRLCKSAADIITQLQARLNRAFGLEMIYLPVSLMSQTSSFVDFLYSIICDGVGFARAYNKAIKNKRQTANLKSNQTIRLLKTDYLNNIIELPFWLVPEIGKRASLYVSLNDNSLRIGRADKIVGTIDSSGDKKQQLIEILRKNKCMIRPKAVTLTLFARLYLADLFVHGTGAANYKYITNRLIRDFYKITNLDFAIATANMTLPIGVNKQNMQITKAPLPRKNRISKEVINYREFFFGLFPKDRLEKLICSQRG